MSDFPLKELQEILLKERDEPLSSIEIKNIFKHSATPEIILYILASLNDSYLNPNDTLVQAITEANSKQDLIPISLCLRYGADPNLYVEVENVGIIHILGYTYLVLGSMESPLLNSVVIMLYEFGSDPNKPIFKKSNKVSKNNDSCLDDFSLINKTFTGKSTLDWLDDQGYYTILHQLQSIGYENVEDNFMTTLATFMDKPSLIPENSKPRMDEVIGSHSSNVLSVYIDQSDPNIGLEISKDYLNIHSFEEYVKRGGELSYWEINKLMLMMKKYAENNNVLPYCQLKLMLISLIKSGAILDKHQINIISDDIEFLNEIDMEYSKPYWSKICSVCEGTVNVKMKFLAYNLNLYPEVPKNILCKRIRYIAQSDPELIKMSIMERQKTRISSDVSYINEFFKDMPVKKCSNNVGDDCYYDYPDMDITYYVDEHDNLWCFLRNNYNDIIKKIVNPYTGEDFPKYFMEDIKRKIKYISNYVPNVDDYPVPISKTVSELNSPDNINNIYTNIISNLFYQKIESNDIDLAKSQIENLSKEDMSDIVFESFNIDVDFSPLTKTHALKTFEIVSYYNLNDITTSKYIESISSKVSEI